MSSIESTSSGISLIAVTITENVSLIVRPSLSAAVTIIDPTPFWFLPKFRDRILLFLLIITLVKLVSEDTAVNIN